MTVAGQTSRLDANEIWEFLFNRTKDAVPEELTNEILADLAAHINKLWIDPLTELQHRRAGAWRTDLDAVPRDRKFLIKYADGAVTLGGYLDNSHTKWPWQGIRPYETGRAERVGDKIVAWMELPSAASPSSPASGVRVKLHRFRPIGADRWSEWRFGPANLTPASGCEWEDVDFVPALSALGEHP